jgi:hypothetical protein
MAWGSVGVGVRRSSFFQVMIVDINDKYMNTRLVLLLKNMIVDLTKTLLQHTGRNNPLRLIMGLKNT